MNGHWMGIGWALDWCWMGIGLVLYGCWTGIGRVLYGHWTGAVIRKLNFRIRPTRFLQIPDNIVSENRKGVSFWITIMRFRITIMRFRITRITMCRKSTANHAADLKTQGIYQQIYSLHVDAAVCTVHSYNQILWDSQAVSSIKPDFLHGIVSIDLIRHHSHVLPI